MASPVNAALCALLATAFWTLLGYALSRRVLPRPLATGAATVMGWAVHSAATLPIFVLIGFSPFTVAAVAALCVIAAGASLRRTAEREVETAPALPWWACAAAAVLALVPAVAILPKVTAGAVHLADPIFDHSKIAMIDAMARQGLPPVNPVFGAAGMPDRLPYYYLWHYSAAELALPLHISGWEADIALTWFTAFASLSLMMGLAVWLGKRSSAAIWVIALAASASLRAVLSWMFGSSYGLEPFLAPPTGFAGWLFQAAWVPQHLMSASCVVTALLLIAGYAQRQRLELLVMLVLVVLAGFESSTYVGGITFAIAALASSPILLAGIEPARRMRVLIGLAVAAVLVIGLAAPFLRDQFGTAAAHGGSPVIVRQFAVLGKTFPVALRRLLDLPAFWLVLLPIELPATYFAGACALVIVLRGAAPSPEKRVAAVLACLVGLSLVVSWLLASTLGDNNDLALRAVLPAAMALIAAAAAGLALSPRRGLIAATAISGLLLSLPDTAQMLRSNVAGTPQPDADVFAQTPELWAAVRRYAPPNARVANDPLFLHDLTPWPVNISWALLANRSSCFAGRELVLALAPLPADRREAVNAQFVRVFAGAGTAQDVDDMANTYRCDVVVLVPQDGAWSKDPFAASPAYRLADNRDGSWRIYVRR